MCNLMNDFLIGEMEAAVRRRMDEAKPFTALDISRCVQGTGVRERHRNLKAAVHGMFERGAMPGYTRTLVTLPSGEQPFLYHPDDTPQTTHRFAVAANVPRSGSSLRASRTIGNVRALDAWNRLRIPARALRDAGLAPGDTVYAETDANGTVRLCAHPSAPSAVRPYRVDRYNIVRLTLKLTTAYFKIEATAQGRIEASPQ